MGMNISQGVFGRYYYGGFLCWILMKLSSPGFSTGIDSLPVNRYHCFYQFSLYHSHLVSESRYLDALRGCHRQLGALRNLAGLVAWQKSKMISATTIG